MGRGRLCAQPCRADPHCRSARRQVRAPPGLHRRGLALHVVLAPLRPRLEHHGARCRACSPRDRWRRALRNGAGSHRSRVPRARPLRSACHLGSDSGRRRCLRSPRRWPPHRRPRVALDLLRQYPGRGFRIRGRPHSNLGVTGRGRATYGRARSRDVCSGAVLDRLRNPSRQRQRLDERRDSHVARRWGAPTRPVRRCRDASRPAHVRRDALPSTSIPRGLHRDLLHRGWHVRDVPVPVDLPAGHPRLLTARNGSPLSPAYRIRLLRAARDASCGCARAPPDHD